MSLSAVQNHLALKSESQTLQPPKLVQLNIMVVNTLQRSTNARMKMNRYCSLMSCVKRIERVIRERRRATRKSFVIQSIGKLLGSSALSLSLTSFQESI